MALCKINEFECAMSFLAKHTFRNKTIACQCLISVLSFHLKFKNKVGSFTVKNLNSLILRISTAFVILYYVVS